MKRCLRRIFVFLLLGAVFTVAISCASALTPYDESRRVILPRVPEHPGWGIVIWHTSVKTRIYWNNTFDKSAQPSTIHEVPKWSRMDFEDTMKGQRFRPWIAEEAIGWPARSSAQMIVVYVDQERADYAANVSGGILVRISEFPWSPALKPQAIPLRPLWPGFAINTVFYAVILWGLFAAPFALRRLRGGRRIKRGLCPKCAYPVGTNEVCTECGAAVVKQNAETQKAEIA